MVAGTQLLSLVVFISLSTVLIVFRYAHERLLKGQGIRHPSEHGFFVRTSLMETPGEENRDCGQDV